MGPFNLFLGKPWLCYLTASLFIGLSCYQVHCRRWLRAPLVFVTGILWILFGWIEASILDEYPAGDAIRLDCCFTIPVIGIFTLCSMIAIWRGH